MKFEAGQDADGREIHQVLLSNAYSQDLIFFIFYDRDMYRVQNYNTWKLNETPSDSFDIVIVIFSHDAAKSDIAVLVDLL